MMVSSVVDGLEPGRCLAKRGDPFVSRSAPGKAERKPAGPQATFSGTSVSSK
jgi:hypothetical protein